MFKRFFTKTRITLITILSLLSITSVGFASWTITAFDVDEEVVGSLESDIVINSKEYVYLDTQKGDLDEQGNKLGYDTFNFYELGFLEYYEDKYSTKVDEEDVISDETGFFPTATGYINAYFIMDLEKCYEMFGPNGLNYDSLSIVIRLEYADDIITSFNIFTDETISADNEDGLTPGEHSINSKIKNVNGFSGVTKLDSYSKNQDLQYSRVITFENILKNYVKGSNTFVTFTLQYEFTATLGKYFYENIYQKMYMDDISSIDFKVSMYITGSDKSST